MRSFLELYRDAKWDVAGRLIGVRSRSVVRSTLDDAASALGATFRANFRPSPLHIPFSTQLLPSIRAFLKACADSDPPTQRYKAATPKLLKALFRQHGIGSKYHTDSMHSHAADLILAAFFFAMRGCEYVRTPRPGKTKRITKADVQFRDARRRLIQHDDPALLRKAATVTITFRDQKSRKKCEARTQAKSQHRYLCPVARWASIIQRLCRMFPDTPDIDLSVDSFRNAVGQHCHITAEFTLFLLRSTCRSAGGFEAFGFHPHELGNPSIRSGAAMALFLMNHSPARIMILGRWSSDAFLVYIRPQVLEWTHNLSQDMVRVHHFTDVSTFDQVAPDDPVARPDPRSYHGLGPHVTMPSFHLFH